MGTYINIGNVGFQRARNSEYVDKSGLIADVSKAYPDVLVGINYDRDTKQHTCRIERI